MVLGCDLWTRFVCCTPYSAAFYPWAQIATANPELAYFIQDDFSDPRSCEGSRDTNVLHSRLLPSRLVSCTAISKVKLKLKYEGAIRVVVVHESYPFASLLQVGASSRPKASVSRCFMSIGSHSPYPRLSRFLTAQPLSLVRSCSTVQCGAVQYHVPSYAGSVSQSGCRKLKRREGEWLPVQDCKGSDCNEVNLCLASY